MKKIIVRAMTAIFACGAAYAQHGHGNCGNCPHHAQHQNKQAQAPKQLTDAEVLASAFPTMKSVKAKGKWNMVYDSNSKLLGYVVYSRPESNGIRGYAGETPVMIAFDTKKVITGVYLLANQETPRFTQHVEQSGFYKQWNGLTVKKAKKQEVDVVSGATFTSRAVVQSVKAVLEKL